MSQREFLVSIVIPVYNEKDNIDHLIKTLLPVISSYQYELLFVNDGSKDETASLIKSHALNNPNIKLVSFTRNFGHQMAQSAGYKYAKGDCVITLDADLQDPPSVITQLISKWREGFEIVYAKRHERYESSFKRITAYLFYRCVNFLSDTPIPKDIGDFRLLDRKVVAFLNSLPERSRFLRGLVSWGGFSYTEVPFSRNKRFAGATHYPLSKMINFALDGITSFSTKPLKLASYFGFFVATIGAFGIVYALIQRLLFPHEYWVTGWTALFIAVMFFGGIQLITIGIMGEYIGKIYQEIQARPQFVVKETVNV